MFARTCGAIRATPNQFTRSHCGGASAVGHSSFEPVKYLLTASTPYGSIALVVLDNGHYAITRNGELLHEHHWPVHQLDDCIDEFVRLSKSGK